MNVMGHTLTFPEMLLGGAFALCCGIVVIWLITAALKFSK